MDGSFVDFVNSLSAAKAAGKIVPLIKSDLLFIVKPR